ncbi:hypothetical protein CVT24_001158 [Panaeolus cyanescens]|uniref:P-loop containing nucleoside triphosphate hydrolase protein n=1 Tax=Panaeolus cyanescens TaxID=181874 RepID=A0A409YZ10_9AGAR|nr:hypothetical protein CVT24_001158 [Panaeolus cyanescens]
MSRTLILDASRLVALVALVVLSWNSLGRKGCLDGSLIFQAECGQTLVSWTYVSSVPIYSEWKLILSSKLYCVILATTALFCTPNYRIIASRSLAVVLFVIWIVYAYRDIYPLATFTLNPQDAGEGAILWYKIGILSFAAILVPLLVPRTYVPVDPKHPMGELAPQQTACWLSMITFTFLDPLIMLGYRVPHLPADQLPPLVDYDDAHYQTSKAFVHMDRFQGAPDRHLFFGFFMHFRKPYAIMTLAIILQAILTTAAPIGLNQTLRYLETRGEGATIRPWFWILWLFIGPVACSMAEHLYLYTATGVRVQTRSLLTQLVFEHSLRMRLATEGTGSAEQGGKTTGNNLLGRINNSVTTDASSIIEGTDWLNLVLLVPLQTMVVMILMYQILGLSALVALTSLIIAGPLARSAGSWIGTTTKRKMEMTDARVQKKSEAISVVRMVKMFGWEKRMTELIAEVRAEELKWLFRMKILEKFTELISASLPFVGQWLTYATFTAVFHQELVPSKIFPTLSLFFILRNQLIRVSWQYNLLVRAKVSLDRVDALLRQTELLDVFSSIQVPPSVLEADSRIGFKEVSFTWSEHSNALVTRPFTLNISKELVFKEGKLNLVTGSTGSGKTAMLLALLGEMHLKRLSPDSWSNLPRDGGIAYAPQEGWVLSTTIRQNILFGSPYDEQRYQAVIKQCALDRDLNLFEAGDQTEVGERGLTLSGGQKARVTLARAVYSRAKILLLDDIFAALDVHTSATIVNECFAGDLMQGRTIILVTHNLPLVVALCEFMVILNTDGTITTQDVVPSPHKVADLLHDVEDEEVSEVIELETKPALSSNPTGKLVMAEEIKTGHITWKSAKLLLSGMGGDRPVLFFISWIAMIGLSDLFKIGRGWFLGYWGGQYETHAPSEVNLAFYLSVFGGILILARVQDGIAEAFLVFGSIRASKTIHARLVTSIFTSTLRWLDETPSARILARCTEDIGVVDRSITQSLSWVLIQTIGLVNRTIAISLFSPIFLVFGVIVLFIGLTIGNLYLKAQLSVKRQASNALSPMLAHFSASMHGLTSIRAYGAEAAFKEESMARLNHYVRMSRTSFNLNRWIGLRIDALGALLTALMASFLVYGKQIGASNTGFSLMFTSEFCVFIFWLIRIFNQLEVESNSLERIQAYIDIDHEACPTESGKPPAAWPTSGDIRVEGLSARYSKTGPVVLHNLSFHIQSGFRVGVVGRTGSGKSSLTLALLRCILTEGEVYYDGVPTSRINLDDLRSKITIIPQTPELLSGTLRQNLDPFGQFDDATMNDALRAAGLHSVQEGGEARITLDTVIAGGGSNLSVGQRQILALARAMLRESKLLILDEATSAIDYKTDAVIQNTLKTQLGSDVTIITVAHRLHTIMDSDRILVLDAGRMVEFDTPANLLQNAKSMLRSLVDNSKDAETLYAKAGVNIHPA